MVTFTQRFDYFRLVLEAPGVPIDELLSANLYIASVTRLESERTEFLVAAGQELVRLLCGDLLWLEGVLRRMPTL